MSKKPIRDATEPLTIEITRDDMRDAVRNDNRKCVYAKACERRFGRDLLGVEVNKTVLRLEFADEIVRYRTRESVVRELVAFDRGGECEPGIYEFAVPTKRRRGKKAKRPNTRPNRPEKATLVHVTGLMRRNLN